MRIALLEKAEDVDLTKFDKVITFCRNDYINVDNYIKVNELDKIYEEVYSGLYLWLNQHIKNKSFIYNDADILQAYGKRIFDFLYNLCQKVYAVREIIEKELPTELWISKNSVGDSLLYPYLSLFIFDFIPPGISLKYFKDEKRQELDTIQPKKNRLFLLDFPLNLVRHLSNLLNQRKGNNILINSDLNKIPVLLKVLKNKNNIFLRENLAERHLFNFLRRGVCVRLFSDFKVSKRYKNSLQQIANSFIDRLQGSSEIITINNSDFTPYVKKYLAAIWQNELIQSLEKIKQIHLLFDRFKIDSLLVDQDRGSLQNLLVQIAKIYGCRSYVNCHGEPFYKISTLPLTSDFIFVWGRQQKKLLIEWGMEKNKIIVTGCSKYDKYLQASVDSARKKICNDLNLSFSKFIGLIAPFPLKERRYIMENTMWNEIKQTIIAVSKFNDIQIIIKLHPGDDNEPHIRGLVKNLNSNNIKILNNYNPLILAKGVDFLAVYISTFAMDGLACKKPVVLTNGGYLERYKRLRIFYDGTTQEKLTDSITNIINGSFKKHITNWQQAVSLCLNSLQGDASENIANLLTKNYR